jgi:hypothetical protein
MVPSPSLTPWNGHLLEVVGSHLTCLASDLGWMRQSTVVQYLSERLTSNSHKSGEASVVVSM